MQNNKLNKHILITGMQRSGTTFTSSVLAQFRDILYIPEPFNPVYGMIGVEKQYSYVDPHNPIDINKDLLNDLFSYRAYFKKNYQQDIFSHNLQAPNHSKLMMIKKATL